MSLVGYADDIGIIIVERDLNKMTMLAELTIKDMAEWYANECLALAHHKTEAILLTGRRVTCGLQFKCGDSCITSAREARYLGVIFERNLMYKTHINTACNKALKHANALSLLMPNRNGADNLARKLYYKVIEFVILYAAPIWAIGLEKNKGNILTLHRTQQTALIRVAQAYRTVSFEALCVITGQIPLDLMVKERKCLYEEKDRAVQGVEENPKKKTLRRKRAKLLCKGGRRDGTTRTKEDGHIN